MDSYHGDKDGNGGASDNIIMWDWQAGEYYEANDPYHDFSNFMWDGLNQDDGNHLLSLLGNQTPLKDCRDFVNDSLDFGDITCKETLEESRESKRRRMLQYPSESNEIEVGNHKTNSSWVAPEVTEISLLCNDEPQSLNWDVQPNPNNLDTTNSLSNGAPYQSSDKCLENCFNETMLHFSPDKTSCSQRSSVYSDGQVDVSGMCEIAPVTESAVMQETRNLSTLKVFKGGNSLIKVKKNLTTSVAYPFTLIKPSGDRGDVTLKDINQRIHAPPPKKEKIPEILGTSAFSGKPVIGKMRIRTEGGKGSITILRTKG